MASLQDLGVIHCYPMAIRSKKSTSLKQQHKIFSFRVGFEKQYKGEWVQPFGATFSEIVWVDKHYL